MTDEAASAEWDYLCKRRYWLRERALANRLYQQQRQRIHELREGLVKAASLAAGSVALANVSDPATIKWAAAVITVGTAASLVFSWGAKARDAARRASEWILLDRDIDRAGERSFTEQDLDAWTARCNEIESGEPAQNEALFKRCSAAAAVALGGEPAEPAPRWSIALVVP